MLANLLVCGFWAVSVKILFIKVNDGWLESKICTYCFFLLIDAKHVRYTFAYAGALQSACMRLLFCFVRFASCHRYVSKTGLVIGGRLQNEYLKYSFQQQFFALLVFCSVRAVTGQRRYSMK